MRENGEILANLVGSSLIIIIAIVIYLHNLINKNRIIKWEQAPADTRDFIKRNEKKINLIIKIVIGCGLMWAFIYFLIPAGLDVPNIINEDYCVVKGEVVSWNYSDEEKIKDRGVGILSEETGETVWVTVYSVGIRKGEYLEVKYLPHTGYGVILSTEEDSEDER